MSQLNARLGVGVGGRGWGMRDIPEISGTLPGVCWEGGGRRVLGNRTTGGGGGEEEGGENEDC